MIRSPVHRVLVCSTRVSARAPRLSVRFGHPAECRVDCMGTRRLLLQRRTGFTSQCQAREVNGVADRFNDSPDVPGTER